MDLNDLLAEVDGIGDDTFVRSVAPVPITAPATPPVALSPNTPVAAPVAQQVEQPAVVVQQACALGMLLDIALDLTVLLGRTRIPLKQLLSFQAGERLLLEQHAEDPLDIYVNDRLIARGEALIVDGALAVKILELLPQAGTP